MTKDDEARAVEAASRCTTEALLDRYTESVKLDWYNPHGSDASATHMLGRGVHLYRAVEILRQELRDRLG